MNRVEEVRRRVDSILLSLPNDVSKRCGYFQHLYGVSQACVLIALKRGENTELAAIAGMLHDVYSYKTLDDVDHARKGAVLAREILTDMGLFTEDEIYKICEAVSHHSDKMNSFTPLDDVLMDADVMQHFLSDPSREMWEHEKIRLRDLKNEFGLQ